MGSSHCQASSIESNEKERKDGDFRLSIDMFKPCFVDTKHQHHRELCIATVFSRYAALAYSNGSFRQTSDIQHEKNAEILSIVHQLAIISDTADI